MSLDYRTPLKSSAPLIVYVDHKSPYAYLAMGPTLAMGDELGIEIDWRPFTLDITSYLGSARLNEAGKVVEEKRSSGQWARVKYAYYDVRRYGSLRGITIRGAVKMWDSSLAGIGMLWAKEQGPAILRMYSTIVYERFWKRELELEDARVIGRVLDEAKADTKGFQEYASGDGRVAYDNLQRASFDAGIFGVPTYVIDGELFFGREHLPRVRWMLTGRRGASPDVEYPIPSTTNAAAGMSSAANRFSVAIDFKSPQAYLAIAPTSAMAKAVGIAVDWLPFIGTPSKFVPSAGDERGARHRQIRADYLEHDVIRYAADRDLPLERIGQRHDSTLAGIGLMWTNLQSQSLAQSYVERVFGDYWRGKLDLEDVGSIRALFDELKIPASGFEGFAAGEGRSELGRIQAELRERGVFDVPTYIFEDEIFFGRQHLALLRTRIHA
jgi:2-hydroxychromene-2-carboxylate isomerase